MATTSKRKAGIPPRTNWLIQHWAALISRRCLRLSTDDAAVPNRDGLRERTSTNTTIAPSRITRSSSPTRYRTLRARQVRPRSVK